MALVSDQLRLLVEDHPDAVAYRVVGEGEWTVAGWDQAASRAARGLIARGLQAQDRVALALQPTDALTHLASYMGVHKAGGACVPLNVRLSADEFRHVLDKAEPHVLIASAGVLDRLRPAIGATESLRHVVVVGDVPEVPIAGADVVTWEHFLDDDATDIQVAIADSDIADILFTSGTTGKPKGVVARHNRATIMDIGKPHDFMGTLWLHASPLFTFAGISFTLVPLRLGMTGLYLPRFDARTWLDVVEREPVVMGFLVPSMVELIIQQPDYLERDLSSVLMLSIGSAPISPVTLNRFHAAVPNAAVSNSYSMTEAGAAYCVMAPEERERRVGSVGQPVPPLRIRIVDESGADLPPDTEGEILLRNPGKEREYFNDPEATAETWTEDGWLRTGDLGRLDADGFLYIMGRMKDVIIRGGNNIHAKDVEDVLYAHPGVQEAAAIGIPHEILGEDVAAVIVPAPGVSLEPDEVMAWCREHLADYKCPRRVEVRDVLPRNAMGKVLKRELVTQLTS